MTTQEIDSIRSECSSDIAGPGKFEGEEIYAPYYYAQTLNGGQSDSLYWNDDQITDIVQVDPSDREIFPELSADTVAVTVDISETGFVFVEELTQEELDGLNAEYEKHIESQEAE